MKRNLLLIAAAMLVMTMLAGCAGTTVVIGECTCPTGSHTETQPQESAPAETVVDTPAEGAVKTGVAILASAAESKNASAEEAGEAKYDVTVVAVTVDDEGIIRSCIIDSIGTSVAFDANGVITTDLTAAIATKNELGDAYGMKLYGGSAYEWNEQAAALAAYAVGKTTEELRSGAVDETGHAADADLATTATIYLGGYVDAIENAVFNAKHLGAQAGDELKLAIIPGVSGSKSADAENEGNAQLDVDAAAMTLKNGVITSCQIDSVQGKVAFDANGVITAGTDGLFPSKNMLGEQYGMVAWGGATAEWNEQAAAFAAYVTGKTAEEVAGIAITETTKPAEGTDLATSVTISIGGFQALIAKAFQ